MSRFLKMAVLAVLLGGLLSSIGCNKQQSTPAPSTGPVGPRAGH